MAVVTSWTKRLPGTFALLFSWSVAAALVVSADGTMASPVLAVVVKTCAIVAVAFVYMRLIAHEVSLDHALFAGVAWLILAILAEIAMTRHLGHAWFELLGSPY